MNITLTTKKIIEEQVTVEFPCFFKSGFDFMGVWDEADVIKFYNSPTYTSFQHSNTDFYSNDIANAFNTWTSITESEFRYEYEKALRQIVIPKKGIYCPELTEPF